MDNFISFIDTGDLRAGGARAARISRHTSKPQAAAVNSYLKSKLSSELTWPAKHSPKLLRTYWYDGALDPTSEGFDDQNRYFRSAASIPGVELRLGRQVQRDTDSYTKALKRSLGKASIGLGLEASTIEAQMVSGGWEFRQSTQQKGVDSLITLDLVRHSQHQHVSTLVLLSGDEDLAEAVHAAQDNGKRVALLTPNRKSVSLALNELADQVITIPKDFLPAMLGYTQEYPWKESTE